MVVYLVKTLIGKISVYMDISIRTCKEIMFTSDGHSILRVIR